VPVVKTPAAGTSPRPRLSPDRVLRAAVELADREGPEALTVRRLADDLQVHATSLYNHVPSKEAILDGVVERLLAEADLPAEVGTWQEWVISMATAMRGLARAHPGAFLVLTRRTADNPAAYRFSELGLKAFESGGFPLRQSVQAVQAVSLAVLGLALNECPPPVDWVEPTPAQLEADGYPYLARAAGELEDDRLDQDGHWETLVGALVAGLEATRAR
jgi:AcrR family transcriptional regulator